jgi:predicted nuclease of predicted toxin-antitoxin system
MRFVCDHDVDAAVAKTLRRLGHEAWTASDAGLFKADDDTLTVYADDRGAVLVTHDVEFSQRRRNSVIGKHLWLRCVEMDAPELVEQHEPEIVAALTSRNDIWVKVSSNGIETSSLWK